MTAAAPVSGVMAPTLIVVPSNPGPGCTCFALSPVPFGLLVLSLLLRQAPANRAITASTPRIPITRRFVMVLLDSLVLDSASAGPGPPR